MAKLTLKDITSGFLATQVINDNNALIEALVENLLSRDGLAPNTMLATLDMNSNRIINTIDPLLAQDVATKNYVDSILASGIADQAGNAGLFLTTDGSVTSWASTFPDQTSQAGNFLTTNGTITAWQAGDLLPSPLVADRLVSNDGATPSWRLDFLLTANTLAGDNANAGALLNTAASSTVPTVVGDKTDPDSGLTSAGVDTPGITAGGILGVSWAEASSGVLQRSQMTVGITANPVQTQGNTPLFSSYNEISVSANSGDVVTLPAAVIGQIVTVVNNGAQDVAIFPASGEDLGAGVDTSVALSPGGTLQLLGTSPGVYVQAFNLGLFGDFTDTQFCAANANGPCMQNEASSVTNPTFVPNRAFLETGVGADSLSVAMIFASQTVAIFNAFGSAVNFMQFTAAVAGNTPLMMPEGADTDIDLGLSSKASGDVDISTPDAVGTLNAGDIILLTGDGGTTSGDGGDILLTTGSGDVVGDGAGGDLIITLGNGVGANPGGLLSITGGTGGATGLGGNTAIASGDGGATSGDSGDITLTIGTSSSTQGAFKFIRAGDTVVVGQVWTSSAADGTGYWAAAAAADATLIVDTDADTQVQVEESADDDIIRFDVGDSPSGFGAVTNIMTLASSGWNVNMGTATGTDETGAKIDFTAGNGGATDGEGGTIELDAGNASGGGAGTGGGFTARGGIGGGNLGKGGQVFIQAGLGGTGGEGGDLDLFGGAGSNTANGGDTTVRGGNAGTSSGDGGILTLEGGQVTAGTGNSGAVILRTKASGTAPGNSGTLTIETGSSVGGTVGDILFNLGAVATFEIDSTGFHAANAAGPALVNEAITTTNPTLIVDRSSLGTGIGGDGADELSIINAGLESLRIDASGAVSLRQIGGSFRGSNVSGPTVNNVASSGSVATLIPNRGTVAGIGGSGGAVDIITGAGLSGLRVGTGPGQVNTVLQPSATSGLLIGSVSGSFGLHNLAASATVPTLLPSFLTETAGIGANVAGSVSLITASLERLRVDVTGNVIQLGPRQEGSVAGSYAILNELATGTNPTLCPNKADQDTGIGQDVPGRVSIIGNGAENMRVQSGGAGDTRFLIFDEDNSTLERVTVGVADSGGVGFKVLRIPN